MKFIDRAKKRRAGIYLVRTRKHFGQRKENGYVGRSGYVHLRRECHFGWCAHRTCAPKPWTDLDPVWFTLRLPWWLSWKWCQAFIEMWAIWLLLPRYNDQLNRRNPRRIPLHVARQQRAQRDRARARPHRIHY